jgi:hypothetical protein
MNAYYKFINYINFKCDISHVPPCEKNMFLELIKRFQNKKLYDAILHTDISYYINHNKNKNEQVSKN